ncbi:MAG: CBS domain-containing protein [Bacilli bacterium]
MTESERIAEFLTEFKELEKELVKIASIDDEFVSFSRALNQIYYNQLNPVVSSRDNYEFLKTASDLRNILSHENDVCAPTPSFLTRFSNIKKAVISPLTCYELASKSIYIAHLDDLVKTAIKVMEKNRISHLPIVDEKGLVSGVFSRSVFFDYIYLHKDMDFDSSYKISDFSEVTGLDSHLNEAFYFVSRYTDVNKAYSLIRKNKAHDKTVGLLLVTEHGQANEKLLGVITLTDLARVSIND